MAVEKGLVLTAIEAKFKGKSLSKTFKERIAEKWAAKIDTDADIEDYINDREDVILEASTEADRRVTDYVKANPKEPKKPEEKETVELPADTPDYVKVMMAKMESMGAEISGFKAQTQQKSLEERFKANPELKGIPEFMFKGRIPTKEEEFDNAVQELKTDHTTFADANKLTNIGLDQPGGGNHLGGLNPKSKEVPAEVKAFAETLKNSNN